MVNLQIDNHSLQDKKFIFKFIQVYLQWVKITTWNIRDVRH